MYLQQKNLYINDDNYVMIILRNNDDREGKNDEKSYFATQILAGCRYLRYCRAYHGRIVEGIFNAVYSGFSNHRNHGAVTNSLLSYHWFFDSDGTSGFAL